jgi:protein-S-isoprenylcysteine O-methyltransferase Ste14
MDPIVYLAAAAVVWGVGHLAFRGVVRRDYRLRGRLTPTSVVLEYVAVGLWVTFGCLNLPPDWPAVGADPTATAIGWTLFVGGFVMVLVNIVHLGVLRSHGQRARPLKRSGFYGLTRNPQIVCFLAAMLGYLVLWPTWRSAGILALAAALSHMMVLTEEEHLENIFGDEYRSYRDRVPRYVALRRGRAEDVSRRRPS